ncbi:MAG: DEAD/DEAH box helicase [Candidatus Woesearchaeota archaeon]
MDLLCNELKNFLKVNNFNLFDFQKEAIISTHSRLNTLIVSPTGSGKTFASFAAIFNELIDLKNKNKLERKTYAIYISPLRALTYDIEKNIKKILDNVKVDQISVATWTGDIKNKKPLKENPPHILLTTPESFSKIILYEEFREIEWIIVDEIHALAENKRLPYLSLHLDLLKKLNKNYFSVTYLTATKQKNIENIVSLDKIIENNVKKDIDLNFLICNNSEKENSFLFNIDLDDFLEKIILIKKEKNYRTILIFTNTRYLAELTTHLLKKKAQKIFDLDNPENFKIETHHSSLSYSIRKEVENKLKQGLLDFVVSSTSLELGIDIGNIDAIVLLGSPKTITKAKQRIGRSKHNVKENSIGYFVPLNERDFLEQLGIANGIKKEVIEEVKPVKNAYDALLHFIITISILNKRLEEKNSGNLISISEIKEILKNNRHYSNFPFTDLYEMLNFLEKNNFIKIIKSLEKEFPIFISKEYKILPKLGTISDSDQIQVKKDNKIIGTIDYDFFEYLIQRDNFSLGGEFYSVKEINENIVYVKKTTDGSISRWYSQYLPMSIEAGNEIKRLLKFSFDVFNKYNKIEVFTDKRKDEIIEELKKEFIVMNYEIYNLLKNIFLYYENFENLYIEAFLNQAENKNYLIFHTFSGKKINDALSKIVGSLVSNKDVEIGIDDLSFYVASDKINLEKVKEIKKLSPKEIFQILENNIQKTTTFRKNIRKLAKKFYFSNYFSEHLDLALIKKEAIREFIYDILDFENVLNIIKNSTFEVKIVDVLSPLSITLFENIYKETLMLSSKKEFLEEMQNLLHNKIALKLGKNFKN